MQIYENPPSGLCLQHLRSLHLRAVLHMQLGRIQDGINFIKHVIAGLKSKGLDDEPPYQSAQMELASQYICSGQSDDAIELLEQLTSDSHRFSEQNRLVVQSLLAEAYEHNGRTAEATSIAEKMVASRKKESQPADTRRIKAETTLAVMRLQSRRAEEAIDILEGILDLPCTQLGENTIGRLHAVFSLAEACYATGKVARAVALLEDALVKAKDQGHITFQYLTDSALASVFKRESRFEEAISHLELPIDLAPKPSFPTSTTFYLR